MHIFSMLNVIFSITLAGKDAVKLEAQINKTEDRIHN